MLVNDIERFYKLFAGWEELFRRVYTLVCTRCYGYYLNYTFCCPIADQFNHDHNNDTGLFVINKELHVDPLKSKSYFKSNKYLNDVRMLYNTGSEADAKAKEDVMTHGFMASEKYWQ